MRDRVEEGDGKRDRVEEGDGKRDRVEEGDGMSCLGCGGQTAFSGE